MPGFFVAPALIFQSVVNGTPDSAANFCICAWLNALSPVRNASAGGRLVLIGHQSTAFGSLNQPNTVEGCDYRIRMNRNSKQVLWDNVLALMKRDFGKENLTALAKKAGFGPGTSTRLKEQTTSVGLDVLDQIAVAFKVKTWHLLLPKLDVYNLPEQGGSGRSWPFEMVDQALYESLPQEDRAFVQGYAARAIEERSLKGNRKAA